ncbi:MAG: LysR family transcriptional regulator [Gammaproteobacteria bacterium]|nr:LysR family transcriptional regulator [Gammaproteobacteria bacterium]
MTDATNMDWNDLRIVLAICREGSLAGAARALGSSHSTVFRQINNIEERFATRFFNRTPIGYEMTEAGELVQRMAGNIEEEILELRRELQGKDTRLQGNIRLTAPEGVSYYLLLPHLESFYRKHPEINIELLVSPVDFEMSRGEADLALRMTDAPPQNCIAKKICDFKMGLYASHSYLDQVGTLDLNEYEYVLCRHYIQPLRNTIWKDKTLPRMKLVSDNILVVARAAVAGMGVTALPFLIGEQESSLKRISIPDIDKFKSVLWILTHADLRQTARVRALMTHLHESMQQDKRFIEGE